jgi:DNA-binding transcriptional ArsR family regulator
MAGSPDGGVVAVEFELTDPAYPFVGLSAAEDCRVLLERILPRGCGAYAQFFTVVGADPDRVVTACEHDALREATVLRRGEGGGLVEFVVGESCPATDLAIRGAIPVEVEGTGGEGRIVAEIPRTAEPSTTIANFMADHEAAELVAKWETESLSSLFRRSELQTALGDRLTERKREVLETAYEAGYYDHDTECTVAALGDRLGISPSTVSQHLAAAERGLVSLVFEERVIDG